MNQNASTSSSSTTFGAPADEISRRAYELWENEGRPEGSDLRHWLQAEQELSARKSGRSPESSQPADYGQSRDTGTDQPLQGTRSSGVQRNGQGQNAAKRKPANAPMM